MVQQVILVNKSFENFYYWRYFWSIEVLKTCIINIENQNGIVCFLIRIYVLLIYSPLCNITY